MFTLFTLCLCFLKEKQNSTGDLLQSLKVSIGIEGVQIRLQQLKAEGVLLLRYRELITYNECWMNLQYMCTCTYTLST